MFSESFQCRHYDRDVSVTSALLLQTSLVVVSEGPLRVSGGSGLLCCGSRLLVQLVGLFVLLSDMWWGGHSAHTAVQQPTVTNVL